MSQWDPRLITPGRALELAGDWPVYADADLAKLSQFESEAGGLTEQADRWQVNLRCGKITDRGASLPGRCGQSITLLATIHSQASLTPAGLLSATLRHMVMAHDVPLNNPEGGRADGR
jgi:hypothetical protein